MERSRRDTPPRGGGSEERSTVERPFAWIPFAIVGYFLLASATTRPLAWRIADGGFFVATVGVALATDRARLSDRATAAILVTDILLTFGLWLSWPPAQGWIILTWVAGTAGGRLPRRPALGILVLLGAAFLAGTVMTAGEAGKIGANALWLGLLFVTIFVIGVQRRGQREYLRQMEAMVESLRRYSEQLEDAQRQLQAEALQSAALAAAEERNRIAREIHDVLAHSLTVIVVQAQAIKRLVRTDPDAAERQADTVATLAREGLQEARRSVSALRAQPVAVDGLGTLRRLVDEFGRQTGTLTHFDVQGAERSISPNAWTTLYRVTQEALTNARRHGQAREVAVALGLDGPIRLTIDDDGAAPIPPVTPGNGLTGMRERADRLGGQLSYRTRPEGGFHVELELPT